MRTFKQLLGAMLSIVIMILVGEVYAQTQLDYPAVTGSSVRYVSSRPGNIGYGESVENPAPASDLVKFLKDPSIRTIYLEGAMAPNGYEYKVEGLPSNFEGAFVISAGKELLGGRDFTSLNPEKYCVGYASTLIRGKEAEDSSVGRVVTTLGADSVITLEGLHIVGSGSGYAPSLNGACLLMTQNVVLKNSFVSGGYVGEGFFGGGIYIAGSGNHIERSYIYNNESVSGGGGVALQKQPGLMGNVIENTLIACNGSTLGAGGVLGASFGTNSQLSLTYCTVVNNLTTASSSDASGIDIKAETVTGNSIVNCLVWGNFKSDAVSQVRASEKDIKYTGVEERVSADNGCFRLAATNDAITDAIAFVNPAGFAQVADIFLSGLVYRTKPVSVSIGKGIAIAGVSHDLDGKRRITPTQPGAFELNGIFDADESYKICYVTKTGKGEMDGTSWENAFPDSDLIRAIEGLEYEVVNVGAGTYTFDRTVNVGGNTRVVGGFEANGSSASVWEKNKTIFTKSKPLSGAVLSIVVDQNKLEGLIIDGAFNMDDQTGIVETDVYASGVKILRTNATKNYIVMQDCRIRNCATMYTTREIPQGQDAPPRFERDNTYANGSGVYIRGDSVVIRNVIFDRNFIVNGEGAAVYVEGNYNQLSSIQVANNKVGGIYKDVVYEASGTICINGFENKLVNSLVICNKGMRASAVLSKGENVIVNCTMTHNISEKEDFREVGVGRSATVIVLGLARMSNIILWNNSGGAVISREKRYALAKEQKLVPIVAQGSIIQRDAELTEGDGLDMIIGEDALNQDPCLNRTPVDLGLLENWEQYDWRIVAGSPAITAGVPGDANRGDLRGLAWANAEKPDAGAYAYSQNDIAKVRYITQNGSGTRLGLTWGTAGDSTMLQQFLNESGVEEVRVGGGVYYATGNEYLDPTEYPYMVGNEQKMGKSKILHAFAIPKGKTLSGGFSDAFKQASKDPTILLPAKTQDIIRLFIFVDAGAIANRPTILDNFTTRNGKIADLSNNGFKGDLVTVNDAFGAAFKTHNIQNLQVNRVNFENCKADNAGAIWATTGSSFTGCKFIKNSALGEGMGEWGFGGAFQARGTVKITNCMFEKNHALVKGGAIHMQEDATVTGSIFIGNKATNDADADKSANANGGAIYAIGNGIITGSEFYKNRSFAYGGAIYALNNVKIIECIIGKQGIRANGIPVNYPGSIPNIDDYNEETGAFMGNRSQCGGGVYIANSVYLAKSVLDCNIAEGKNNNDGDNKGGGAIMIGRTDAVNGAMSTENVLIEKNKIYRNSAMQGGVIYAVASHGQHTVLNNLITSNEAYGTDAAIIWCTSTQAPGRPVSPIGYNTFCQNAIFKKAERIPVNGDLFTNNSIIGGVQTWSSVSNNLFWGNSSNSTGAGIKEFPFRLSDGRGGTSGDVFNAKNYHAFSPGGNGQGGDQFFDYLQRIKLRTGFETPFENPFRDEKKAYWNLDPRNGGGNPNQTTHKPTGLFDIDEPSASDIWGRSGSFSHGGFPSVANTNYHNFSDAVPPNALIPTANGGGIGIRSYSPDANWHLTCILVWNNADAAPPFSGVLSNGEQGLMNPARQTGGAQHLGWGHSTFAGDPEAGDAVRTSPSYRGWLGETPSFGVVDDIDGRSRLNPVGGKDENGCPIYFGNAPGCYVYMASGATPEQPTEVDCQSRLMFLMKTQSRHWKLIKSFDVDNVIEPFFNGPPEQEDRTGQEAQSAWPNDDSTSRVSEANNHANGDATRPPRRGIFWSGEAFSGSFVGDIDKITGEPLHTIRFKVDPFLTRTFTLNDRPEYCKGLFATSSVAGNASLSSTVKGIGVRISYPWRYVNDYVDQNALKWGEAIPGNLIVHNVGGICGYMTKGIVENCKVTIDEGIDVVGVRVGGIVGKDFTEGVNVTNIENCSVDIKGHLVGTGNNTNARVMTEDNAVLGGFNLLIPSFDVNNYVWNYLGTAGQPAQMDTYAGGIIGQRNATPDDGKTNVFNARVSIGEKGTIRGTYVGGMVGRYEALRAAYFKECELNVYGVLQGTKAVGGISSENLSYVHDCVAHFSRNSIMSSGTFASPMKKYGLYGGSAVSVALNSWYSFPDRSVRGNELNITGRPATDLDNPASNIGRNRASFDNNLFPLYAINPKEENMTGNQDIYLVPQRLLNIPIDDANIPVAYYNDYPSRLVHAPTLGMLTQTSENGQLNPWASISLPNQLLSLKQTRLSRGVEENVARRFTATIYPTPLFAFKPEYDFIITSRVRPDPDGRVFITPTGGAFPVSNVLTDIYSNTQYRLYGNTWENALAGNSKVGIWNYVTEAFDAENVKEVYISGGNYDLDSTITMWNNQLLFASCNVGLTGKDSVRILNPSASPWDFKNQTVFNHLPFYRTIEASRASLPGNRVSGIQVFINNTDDNVFFKGSGGSINATDNFDIYASYISGARSIGNGGGIHVAGGGAEKFSIKDVGIVHCESISGIGGALYLNNVADITLSGLLFANNSADSFGAFFVESTPGVTNRKVTLSASTIVRNKTFSKVIADENTDASISSDSITLMNTIMWGNSKKIPLKFNSPSVSLSECAFDGENLWGYSAPIQLNRDNDGNPPRPPYFVNYYDGPCFVKPSPYYGPRPTITDMVDKSQPLPDISEKWDWRLKMGSPCIKHEASIGVNP